MKFKYQEFGEVHRPVVPVIISHGSKSIRHDVLLDSGSDRCYFDATVAGQLGISKEDSEVSEVFGVNGQIALYFSHPVTMKVGDRSFKLNAGFVSNISGGLVPYGYVGHAGFFDKFLVAFDTRKCEVELRYRS